MGAVQVDLVIVDAAVAELAGKLFDVRGGERVVPASYAGGPCMQTDVVCRLMISLAPAAT